MRPTLFLLPLFFMLPGAALGLACSSGSSPAASHDAGVDAAADATDDSCFPFCGSSGSSSGGSSGDDAGDASCAQLKTQLEMLQAPAQACDPTKPTQCTSIAQGVCCAITVTAGNDMAVNTFQEAVDSFKAMCDAGCLTPVCPTAPSNVCQGQGTMGTCQ